MQTPSTTAYPFEQATLEQEYPALRMNANSQQGSRQGERPTNISQERPINSRFKGGVDDFSRQEEDVQRSVKKFPDQPQEDLAQRSQYGGGGNQFGKGVEIKQKIVQEGFVDHDELVIPTSEIRKKYIIFTKFIILKEKFKIVIIEILELANIKFVKKC